MKDRIVKSIILVLVLLVSMVSFAQAEIDADGGVYLRSRHELWVNPFDQDSSVKDNRNYFRFKLSLWGSLGFEDIGIAESGTAMLKMTDEFKAYSDYYSGGVKKDTTFDLNEMIVDNLYVDLKSFLFDNVDVRIGRQDFLGVYGEGFLIMDGTPLDGSRTFYFNAVKASIDINDENKLDVIYTYNPKTDDLLPIINGNNRNQSLTYTDEQGWIAYLKNTSVENLKLEPFYIFKDEDAGGPKLRAESTQLHTIGSYVKYALNDTVTLRGQAAYQFGEYGANDRTGFGGYAIVDKSFKDIAMKPTASLGYYYLSGDDTSTSEMEGWNPVYSQWPWLSEYYVLTYAAESGLGYWTNLQAFGLMTKVIPTEKSKLSVNYYYMLANEKPTGTIFGDGNERGHLPQARFDYKFSKNVSAYGLMEYFIPGDFYLAEDRDPGLFTRVEVTVKF